MTTLSDWLDELAGAATRADEAEVAYRAESARRIAALAGERAFAHRRANLMRAVADAVASAPDEETAVAHGLGSLRYRLGWSEESEARSEILERFAPVCSAAFTAMTGDDGDPAAELAAFEAWYAGARGSPFWTLFEVYIRETPVVDF